MRALDGKSTLDLSLELSKESLKVAGFRVVCGFGIERKLIIINENGNDGVEYIAISNKVLSRVGVDPVNKLSAIICENLPYEWKIENEHLAKDIAESLINGNKLPKMELYNEFGWRDNKIYFDRVYCSDKDSLYIGKDRRILSYKNCDSIENTKSVMQELLVNPAVKLLYAVAFSGFLVNILGLDEVICVNICGNSGSGKSSLLKIIMSFFGKYNYLLCNNSYEILKERSNINPLPILVEDIEVSAYDIVKGASISKGKESEIYSAILSSSVRTLVKEFLSEDENGYSRRIFEFNMENLGLDLNDILDKKEYFQRNYGTGIRILLHEIEKKRITEDEVYATFTSKKGIVNRYLAEIENMELKEYMRTCNTKIAVVMTSAELIGQVFGSDSSDMELFNLFKVEMSRKMKIRFEVQPLTFEMKLLNAIKTSDKFLSKAKFIEYKKKNKDDRGSMGYIEITTEYIELGFGKIAMLRKMLGNYAQDDMIMEDKMKEAGFTFNKRMTINDKSENCQKGRFNTKVYSIRIGYDNMYFTKFSDDIRTMFEEDSEIIDGKFI